MTAVLASIRRNPATSIAALGAAIPFLIAWIASERDRLEPLGVSPWVFVGSSAVLAVLALGLQAWQAARDRVTRPVTWSWFSIVGYALGVAGVLQPFLDDFADASLPLGVPAGFWFVVGEIFIGVTSFGRVWQALGGTVAEVKPT